MSADNELIKAKLVRVLDEIEQRYSAMVEELADVVRENVRLRAEVAALREERSNLRAAARECRDHCVCAATAESDLAEARAELQDARLLAYARLNENERARALLDVVLMSTDIHDRFTPEYLERLRAFLGRRDEGGAPR